MRAYKTINGKVVYSSWTGIQCKINTVSRLNAATKKSHSTYKIYNVQGKKTKTSTHTLTAEEKKILKKLCLKAFQERLVGGKEGRIYCGLDKKEFEIWQDTDRLA